MLNLFQHVLPLVGVVTTGVRKIVYILKICHSGRKEKTFELCLVRYAIVRDACAKALHFIQHDILF